MSLRRPTVALLIFTFDISPLCDVTQTSDCGTHRHLLFQYKPFMWCRPDARLRHCYFIFYLSRRRFRHPIGSYLCFVGISGGLPPFPFYLPCYANFFKCTLVNYSWRIHACICYILRPNCLASTFKVLTGLLIWPDADEGDLMDEEFNSESDT